MTRGRFGLAAVVILIVAGALRLWRIDHAPLWMDEAFSLAEASSTARTIAFGALDVHPPLFTLIEHVWLTIQPDISFARIPAALIGIATVSLVIAALSDLASRWAGLIAGAVLAVSVAHIWHSQDARMYTLQLAGLTVAIWGCAGLAAERRARWRYGALYVLGGTIAVYSQSISLLFLASINGGALLALLSARDRARLLGALVAVNAVLLVLVLPWLLAMRSLSGAYSASGSKDLHELGWTLRNVLGFPGLPNAVRRMADYAALVAIAGFLVLALRRGDRRVAVVVAGGLILFPLAMILATTFAGLIANRLFLPLVLPASMAIGLGAAAPGARAWVRSWSWAVVGGLVAAGLWADLAGPGPRKIDNPAAVIALIDRVADPTAPIVTCHFFLANGLWQRASLHPIYFSEPGGKLLRFDGAMADTVGRGILWRHRLSPAQIDGALGGGHLGSAQSLDSPIMASLDQPCSEENAAAIDNILRAAHYWPTMRLPAVAPSLDRAAYQETYSRVTIYVRK